MFDPQGGGHGFEMLQAISAYDWEMGRYYAVMGIPEFESGSRFIVEVEDHRHLPFPIRIFSPREWQGLLHWGLGWHYRDSPESLALIRSTEEQVYDTTGLAEFIDERIKGRVDWEHGYPLDNPVMMDRLRVTHPNFPYDEVTLNTDRSEA